MPPSTFFESPPVAKSALCLTTPVDDSGAALPPSSRLSNLDLTSRLVKRGLTVSHAGERLHVLKVSRGYLYGKPLSLFGLERPSAPVQRLRCESVQVLDK